MRGSKDENISWLVASREGTRDRVPVSTGSSWEERLWVQRKREVDGLTSSVGNADWRTTINNEWSVSSSLVTDFTKEVVNDSITTSGKFAVGSARVGTVGVQSSTIIAFLSVIDNAITASWQLAVVSAARWEGVAVVWSVVASLSRVESSVSAFSLAG